MAAQRWGVGVTVIATSLFVSASSKESFRTPKDLLFHFLVLGMIALHAIAWASGTLPPFNAIQRKLAWTLGAILAWTAITAATSSNVLLSSPALLHATLLAAFFWIAVRTGATRESAVLILVLAASIPNSVVAALQRHRIWSPFQLEDLGTRLTVTGFLGNPNDLGAFLVPCALTHLAATLGLSGARRYVHAAAFGLACYAVALSQSTTGLGALVLGIGLVIANSFRANLRRGSAIVLVVLSALTLSLPLAILEQDHLRKKFEAARTAQVTQLLGGSRLLAYSAAWILVRDNPGLGSGPGTFSWRYLQSVRIARDEYPVLRSVSLGGEGIAGEVHNDYLEILAETGFPGLLLLIGALATFVICERSVRIRGECRSNVARKLAPWPLAVSLMVQMATNFPLQITAVTMIYLYLGAYVLACHQSSEPV
jgi:hypothetical protein